MRKPLKKFKDSGFIKPGVLFEEVHRKSKVFPTDIPDYNQDPSAFYADFYIQTVYHSAESF